MTPNGQADDAVPAAVAHVVLDHHGAELGAEQRAGRAHVQAGRLGAVLAHVAGHQPADALGRASAAAVTGCSMNATCRQVDAPRPPVLS